MAYRNQNYVTNKKIKAEVNKNQKDYVAIKTYYFKSYNNSEGETLWAEGTAQTTGVKKNNFTEIKVLTNTVQSFVGQKMFISSSANTDGTTLYPLYTDAGQTAAEIYVKISESAFPEEQPQQQTPNSGESGSNGITEPSVNNSEEPK